MINTKSDKSVKEKPKLKFPDSDDEGSENLLDHGIKTLDDEPMDLDDAPMADHIIIDNADSNNQKIDIDGDKVC